MNDRVTLLIVSCKRAHMCCQAIDSFAACCLDMDLIDRVVISDDNSEPVELVAILERTKAHFPTLPIILKHRVRESGFWASWAHGWAEVRTPFVFHAEDDWIYTQPEHHIRYAQAVMEANPSVAEVAFSYKAPGSHYRDFEGDRSGFWSLESKDEYYLFPPWDGQESSWPGYTTNPALIHLDRINQHQITWPQAVLATERVFGQRYSSAGLRVAFMPKAVTCHIGVPSAFRLNATHM